MSFQLISSDHQEILEKIVINIPHLSSLELTVQLSELIHQVYQAIPEKRRSSTGRYSIIKALGGELHSLLVGRGFEPSHIAAGLINDSTGDPFLPALGLKILVDHTLENNHLSAARSYFEVGAGSKDWILRECASGLVRPLIKAFPNQVREWYLQLVRSPDPKLRRYVSESLRPVVENRWFHKTPEYALEIIKGLFQEPAPYPRTSVGNNLSDWMRVDQETTWPIVKELAESGDQNSYWIAYRACRNLVKTKPRQVMSMLGVDEYKYKKRVYRRADLEG